MHRISVGLFSGMAMLAFVGCIAPIVPAFAAQEQAYILGSGDKIRVTVYNEKDLSGDFDVNGQGFVALPLIGQVEVGGKTVAQVTDAITKSYGTEYLFNPRVSVEVMNYRPFYILGEVNHQGTFPYVSGMTIIQAVTMAGGYTQRADHSDIRLKHQNQPEAKEERVKEDTIVAPGDTITVKERIF